MTLEEELKIAEFRYSALKNKVKNVTLFDMDGEIIKLLNQRNFRAVWVIMQDDYEQHKTLFNDYCLAHKQLQTIKEEINKRDNFYQEEDKILNS